jgi:predicted ester cyclase
VSINKDLVRRFSEEVFVKLNVDLVDELVDEGFVDHTAPPGAPPGREGIKLMARAFSSAFSDWRMDINGMVAEGDTVVFWGTGRGKHIGDFMGVSGTGKEITIPGVHVVRIANGKIVEHRGYSDQLGTLQQLGLAPAK